MANPLFKEGNEANYYYLAYFAPTNTTNSRLHINREINSITYHLSISLTHGLGSLQCCTPPPDAATPAHSHTPPRRNLSSRRGVKILKISKKIFEQKNLEKNQF